MLASGIYCIENIYNGRMYIGSSFKIVGRIAGHFSLLKRNKSHNNHLQASYNKYGRDAFIGYVIEYCEKDKVKDREQFWISNTMCLTQGFNQCKIAFDNSGWHHSDELKADLSKKRLGAGNPMFGVKLTEAQREVIRKRSTGRLHAASAINKMIENRRVNKHNYIGSKCGKAILNENKVLNIKKDIVTGISFSILGEKYNISPQTIAGIFNNRRWKHVVCNELDEYKKTYKINSRQLGERNKQSKLRENDIRAIRSIKGKSYRAIGRMYNVSNVTIRNIITMKIWKNVV